MSDILARAKAFLDDPEWPSDIGELDSELIQATSIIGCLVEEIDRLKAQPPCGADGAVPDELAADVAALGVSLDVSGYRNDAELLYKAAEKLRLLASRPAAPVAQRGVETENQKFNRQQVAPATVAVPDDEPEWPDYHEQGMGCGLEDRGITDRYDACRHGWVDGVEACQRAFDNWRASQPQPDPEGYVTVEIGILSERCLDAAIKDAGIAQNVCADLDVVLSAGIHAYLLAAARNGGAK